MNKITVKAIITGKVQGVGYRNWTEMKAGEFSLSGWVRNLTDGSVEALFEGGEENVNRMLKACEDGPMLAKVENISRKNHEFSNISGFSQKPTI